MSKRHSIFLIGPMGAGKTSIGKQLAKLAGFEFYDSDHLLQKRTGTNLAWIYHLEKEEGLRKRETEVLKEVVTKKNIVLATGGGTIIIEENRQLLLENGLIIYLQASLEKQKRRTRHHKDNRPLLDIDQPDIKILELHQQRAPLYQQLSHLTYDTDDYAPHLLAKKIFKDLKARDFF